MSIDDILQNEAEASGFEFDWLPEGFKRIGGFITASKKVGKGNKEVYEDVPVCGDFKALSLTRDNQSTSWATEIEFADYDGKKKTILISHGQLAGDGSAVRELLSGAGLHMPTDRWGREKFNYLLSRYRPKKRVTTYPTPGLYRHDDGATFICPSGEAIAEYESDDGIECRLTSVPRGPFIKGTLKAYQEAAKAVFAEQRLPHVGLGVLTGCAGTIVNFGDLASCSLWITGPSTRGKTWMQIAGATQWGSAGNNECVLLTPNGTVNALDYDYSVGSGASLHYDEGMLSDSKTLYQLGFKYASGMGKKRLRAQKGGEVVRQNSTYWAGFLTVSSEKALSVVAYEAKQTRLTGSAVRMPTVDISNVKPIDPPEANRLRQIMTNNYGHVGPKLVRHLLDRGLGGADGPATIQKEITRVAKTLVDGETNPATVRAAEVFAILAVTGTYLIEADLLPGVVSADIDRCVAWGWNSFLASTDSRVLKTGQNAVDELMAFLMTNPGRVKSTLDQTGGQEVIAYYDQSEPVVYLIDQNLAKIGISAGVTTLIQELKNQKKLLKSGDRWIFKHIPRIGPLQHYRLELQLGGTDTTKADEHDGVYTVANEIHEKWVTEGHATAEQAAIGIKKVLDSYARH